MSFFSKFRVSSLVSLALLAPSVLGGHHETCPNPQLSCHTSSNANTCCVNYPGGVLLQTQYWDYSPSAGPSNSWTIHGLWPDHCNGNYNSYCDKSREYKNITQILQQFGKTNLLTYMKKYWASNEGSEESFWEYEWAKHGTCVSTLQPDCFVNYEPTQEVPDFFQTVVNVFKTVDSYKFLSDAGITPSNSKTYTLSEVTSALQKGFGGGVVVECSDNALNEIYYYFNVRGPLPNGTFQPTSPDGGSSSSCSSSGIKYPPKS